MFRNARLYRLAEPSALDLDDLEARLGRRRFRRCGPIESVSMGWFPSLGGQTEALAHTVGGCVLLCVRRQERLLPASVVAEALDERVAEVEEREARGVGRTERRRLREEVLTEMLPRAFLRSRQIRAYLDPAAGWMVVDAASAKAAEELVSLLRESLGSLQARPPQAERPVVSLLTEWVTEGRVPDGLELGDECELRDARDERAIVRCRGHDLSGEEISTHLRSGKQVVKLALDWKERLSFLIDEDLSLKRLRFSDALIDEAEDPQIENEAARADAEFAIMSLELRELLGRFDAIFGLSPAK